MPLPRVILDSLKGHWAVFLLLYVLFKGVLGPHCLHTVRRCGRFLHMSHVRALCVGYTSERCRTAEPIEIPFRRRTRVGPGNLVADGGPDPPRERSFERTSAVWVCGCDATLCQITLYTCLWSPQVRHGERAGSRRVVWRYRSVPVGDRVVVPSAPRVVPLPVRQRLRAVAQVRRLPALLAHQRTVSSDRNLTRRSFSTHVAWSVCRGR